MVAAELTYIGLAAADFICALAKATSRGAHVDKLSALAFYSPFSWNLREWYGPSYCLITVDRL